MPASCESSSPGVSESDFGTIPDGGEVKLFALSNTAGLVAKVSEYGAILVSMEVPDRKEKLADVTHGCDDLAGWLTKTSYFGSTVGRFGNRIAGGKFTLEGKEYVLAANNDPGGIPCALHGGLVGFDKMLWKGKGFVREGACGVALTHTSVDGEEGYPGNLT